MTVYEDSLAERGDALRCAIAVKLLSEEISL
jgi:hypothetical protein